MSLEQILGQRYRVTTRLPAQTSTHQRYTLESADGSGQRFVLSFRDYSSPISASTVAQQEALIQTLSRPPSALLCRAVEWLAPSSKVNSGRPRPPGKPASAKSRWARSTLNSGLTSVR